MAFEPGKITHAHILEAVKKIKSENIDLMPSTRWDVIIDGEAFPPKEIMRYAHEQMNGEKEWKYSGGEQTNKFLKELGFDIVDKTEQPIQEELIERYKTLIREDKNEKELYKWRLIQEFQEKWDIDADDFAGMAKSIEYDNLLHYTNKTLIHFSQDYPEKARYLFKMLYDEDIPLKKRIEDFGQQAEQLVKEHYPDKGAFQDERTIATYLTFRYPDKYTFYKYSFYSDYTNLLGIDRPSAGERYIHYLSLMDDFIENFIFEDQELIELSRETLTVDCYVDENLNILAQDILFRVIEGEKHEAWIGNMGSDVNGSKKPKINYPVNHILYGPPGTGKTFALRNTYAPYFTEEQKLKTKKEYEVEVVEEFSWWEVIALVLLEEGKLTVPEIKEHRFIRIKENLSNSSSVNATIWGQLQTHTSPDEKNVGVSNRQEPYLFRKQKNSVWSIILENCEQKAPYLLKALEEIEQYESKVETKQNYRFTTFHQSFTYEDFVEGIKPKLNSQSKESDSNEIEYTIEKGIFYQAADEACRLAGFMGLQDCLSHSEEERKNQFRDAKPYALFIDEINRGNISAILGELITLIEKDKRLTADHELIVQLPYSKNSFGVPPNLYIVGTLNTADRSVEALDKALRRRFSFTEVDPDPDLLEGIEVAGIDIEKVLRTINLRIVKLLDRDHKIGHSYFLPLKEKPNMELLQDVFQDRVIPLLKEYFFGDFGKIGLVLGSSFVKEVHSENVGVFAEFSGYEEISAEYDERKVYAISPKHEWNFKQIYSPKDTDE